MDYQHRVALGESFTNLPWLTDAFKAGSLIESVAGCTEIEAYAQELAEGESIFYSPEFVAIKKYLAGGTLNQTETRVGIGRLTSYRLVDIALWRHSRQTPPKCKVKDKDCVLFQEQTFKALQTWTILVADAYASSQKVADGRITHDVVDSEHPFVLHTLIDECREFSGFYAILGNFAKAAFHLQYLLKGFKELPADALQIAKGIDAESHPEFRTFRLRKVNITRIRNALHLALMSTPMCLLSMTNVEHIFHSAINLADTFVTLNPNRPEPVLHVDWILWNLIFDAALGKVSLHRGLPVALKEANEILSAVDCEATEWYSSEFERCKPLPPPTPSAAVMVRPEPRPSSSTVVTPTINTSSTTAPPYVPQLGGARRIPNLTNDFNTLGHDLPILDHMDVDDHPDNMMEVDQAIPAQNDHDEASYLSWEGNQSRRLVNVDKYYDSNGSPQLSDEEDDADRREVARHANADGHDGDDEDDDALTAGQSRSDNISKPLDNAGRAVDEGKGGEEASGEETADNEGINTAVNMKDGKRVRDGSEPPSESDNGVKNRAPKKKLKTGAPGVTGASPRDEDAAFRRSIRLKKKKDGDKMSEMPKGTAGGNSKRRRSGKKALVENTEGPASTTGGGAHSKKYNSSDDEVIFLGGKMNLGVEFTELYVGRRPRVKVELDEAMPSFEKDAPDSSAEEDPLNSPPPMQEFPRVVGNKPVFQYDLSTGERMEYIPQFHYDAELQLLYSVEEASQKMQLNGRPAYFAPESEQSFIHRMSYNDFCTLDMKIILDIFRRKHILVYGKPDRNHKFDAESLQDVLGTLRRSCTIQGAANSYILSCLNIAHWCIDLSIPADSDFSVRQREGCAMDILNSHRRGGRCLNGLDFRRSFDWDSDQKKKLETDMIAWAETEQQVLCPLTHNFPLTDMRWALAATSGCYSHIHIDSSGFATCIECLTGKKDWFVGVPMEGDGYDAFSSLGTFTGDYDFRDINDSRFRWEKLTLDSTTLFFQRPGTPHVVFTPEAALVRGRFFYSTPTLRETVTAYYHECIQHSIITNTEHQEASVIILSRMLAMYNSFFVWGDDIVHQSHLPDLSTFEGVFDVLTICTFFEVSNTLMKWGSDDSANIRLRHFLIRSRKRARELVAWISHKYAFVQDIETVNCLEDVYWPYVAKVGCLLYRYRLISDKYRGDGVNTSTSTLRILRRSFKHLQPVSRLFEIAMKNKDIPQTFAWTGPFTVVEPKSDMGKFIRPSIEGLNADDMDAGLTHRHVHFEETRYYSSVQRPKDSSKTPAPSAEPSLPPSSVSEEEPDELEQNSTELSGEESLRPRSTARANEDLDELSAESEEGLGSDDEDVDLE